MTAVAVLRRWVPRCAGWGPEGGVAATVQSYEGFAICEPRECTDHFPLEACTVRAVAKVTPARVAHTTWSCREGLS
jgi:hypothetical protein